MATFHYTAKRSPTETVEGDLEAQDRGGALSALMQAGYVPVRVTEQASEAPDGRAAVEPAEALTGRAARGRATIRLRRVPASHLLLFTRQFASLTRSAVPILRALNILEDQARHPALRLALHEIGDEVRQGQVLSSAMARFPTIFPSLYIALVRSGELSGALDVVLDRLAEQGEQDEAMRHSIRMALVYPSCVGVVGCGTVIFLMTFVMPRLSRLLTGLGDRLPPATRLLLAVTEWMTTWWWWAGVAGLIVGGALAWRVLGARGRLMLERGLLRVPFVGPMIRQMDLARVIRSLGLELHHGIPILQAMEVAVGVAASGVIREQLARLPEGLRQGQALSSCLKTTAISTPLLIHTVVVGEENGKVGEALTEVATYYERDTERRLRTFATLLEPLLIVAVGGVVGIIVMAVLLPIFEMSAIR
jgi:type II secretory pathway component PulF